MKLVKTIFVGSLLLLMSATPLIAASEVKENNDITDGNANGLNSLGNFTITHQPWLWGGLFRGPAVGVEYELPDDNPTLQFYFSEDENGYVDMNFTIGVEHRLNQPGIPYFASWIWPDAHRWTVITLWINYDGQDYLYKLTPKNCNTDLFEEYEISLGEGEPLKTDGQTLKCLFWWKVHPGISKNTKIHDIIGTMKGWPNDSEDIYINPE